MHVAGQYIEVLQTVYAEKVLESSPPIHSSVFAETVGNLLSDFCSVKNIYNLYIFFNLKKML